jgi:hypothetical protein
MSLSPEGRGQTACGGLAKCVSPPCKAGCTTHFVIRRKAAVVTKLDEFVSHSRRRKETTDQNGCDGSARISRGRKVPAHPLWGRTGRFDVRNISVSSFPVLNVSVRLASEFDASLSDRKMTGRKINPCDKRLNVLFPAHILNTTRIWDSDLSTTECTENTEQHVWEPTFVSSVVSVFSVVGQPGPRLFGCGWVALGPSVASVVLLRPVRWVAGTPRWVDPFHPSRSVLLCSENVRRTQNLEGRGRPPVAVLQSASRIRGAGAETHFVISFRCQPEAGRRSMSTGPAGPIGSRPVRQGGGPGTTRFASGP